MAAPLSGGTGITVGAFSPGGVPGQGYITPDELRGLAPCEAFEAATEDTLQMLIASGAELINSHCGRHFTGVVPALVKTVNAELARTLSADLSKQSESIDGYSYSNNTAALGQILVRLDFLLKEDGDTSALEQAKDVRARVI